MAGTRDYLESKVVRLNGVTQPNHYKKEIMYRLNSDAVPELLAIGTHTFAKIPKGYCLCGMRLVMLDKAGGTANGKSGNDITGTVAQMGLEISGNNNGSPIQSDVILCDDMKKNYSFNYECSGLECASMEQEIELLFSVGGAAFTSLDILIYVELLPMELFLTNG